MGAMRNLWSDPTFLDAIQPKQAAEDTPDDADDAAPAGSPAPAPTAGGTDAASADLFRMRKDEPTDDKAKKPKLTLTQDDLDKITHTDASKEVTRAEVEKALKQFLVDLAKAQKHKDNAVTSSDKVWQADVALHQNLANDVNGPYTPKGGDGKDYDAGELAAKIAGQLPDTIPIENFNRFRKLTPQETVLPGSTTDQIRKKYEAARDTIVAKVTKEFGEKAGKLAKAGLDAAVEKGVPYVIDGALKGAGVGSDVEGAMKKIVDEYVKKVTDDKKDEKK